VLTNQSCTKLLLSFDHFLLTLPVAWPWLLALLSVGVLVPIIILWPSLQRHKANALRWRQELDTKTLLFQQERGHAEHRLHEMMSARQELSDRFQALSKQALQENNRQFLDLAAQVFVTAQQQAKTDLDKRQEALHQTLHPVREALGKLEADTRQLTMRQTGAYEQLQGQIKNLMLLQHTVHSETDKLVQAIRKPTVRGRWGEMTLRRVLESAGMLANCDFLEQVTSSDSTESRLRPDVVVRLPEGRSIVIDAKTPFDAYLDTLEATSEEQRRAAQGNHARQVKNHIKNLSSKAYWDKLSATPEFVILFIPGESAFSAALEADPSLLEIGWQHRVVLATPTTLVATIMAVAYSWKQDAMAKNAEKTVAHGKELYERLCNFVGHLQDSGKGLQKAVSSYNQAVASLEARVLPKARAFESMGVTSTHKSLPSLPPLDVLPRSVMVEREDNSSATIEEAA
jgi:DNA recombination protein RmuC